MTLQVPLSAPIQGLEAPPSTTPQVYKHFPKQIPAPLIEFIKQRSAMGNVVIPVDSPKGGTAWLIIDPLDKTHQIIVLQNPPTGPRGEIYHPMIAQYDAQTGKRIDHIHPTESITTETEDKATKILEP
jgi:hypothetical protein